MVGSGLAPIIRKGDLAKPFPSPHFEAPPSPVNGEPANSYFSPTPISPSHSGILLNKPPALVDPALESPLSSGGGRPVGKSITVQSPSHGLGLGEHSGIGAALGRVGSPDGASSTDGSSVAGSTSTAPSSIVGSPDVKAIATLGRPNSPAESMATLSLQNPPEGYSQNETATTSADRLSATLRMSRSPSPHCHFAPLPVVEQQERPGTRRNSTAQGNVPRAKLVNPDGATPEAVTFESDESPFPASNLTSSLLDIKNGTTAPAVGFRRATSGSYSGRSASPSPPRRSSSSQSSNRSHSPPMISRHASQDALHLHRIQTGRTVNRSSSRERGERGVEWEGISPLGSRVHSRDRDEWASDSNLGTGRSSPAASSEGDQPRRTMAFVEPERGIAGRCKPASAVRTRSISIFDGGVEREVVEVDPQSEVEEDLDDFDEEEEDQEDEDEEEDVQGEEDDEGETNDAEDDEDEDAFEIEQELSSRTAKGAGVEVVHWHKEDIDTTPSTPSAAIAPSA